MRGPFVLAHFFCERYVCRDIKRGKGFVCDPYIMWDTCFVKDADLIRCMRLD